jgi:hypothetical protein
MPKTVLAKSRRDLPGVQMPKPEDAYGLECSGKSGTDCRQTCSESRADRSRRWPVSGGTV